MTIFKTFLKVLNKLKTPIIIYTVFLIFFAGFNMQTSDNPTNFKASKPSIYILNHDKENAVTKNLISYMKTNCKIVDLEELSVDDALFYREISYAIYIPEKFGQSLLNGNPKEVKIKSTKDYNASLTEMLLDRYLQVANTYSKISKNEEEFITDINETLSKKTEVEIMSKLDTTALSKATFYYNFLNYSLLAGLIYVICLILSSFKERSIRKRTMISSMSDKEYNRRLLLSNGLFALVLWLFYILLSLILVGDIMLSEHGLIYIINSFLFMCCALSIAFSIGTLLTNKNAINGIINVIALGSSFLCGAFVPMEMLPSWVLTIAHILPSYWYIKTNELLKGIESVRIDRITPIMINMLVIAVFTLIFVVFTNIVTKRRKID